MASDPLPLVASELLTATCTAAGAVLDANDPWLDTFGNDGLWSRLPPEDARFAQDYVVDAARGSLVAHQVFLVDRPGADVPVPVLLHFLPVRVPGAESGHFPVALVGETLREPASWAAEQTRRRRLELLGRMTMGVAHDFNNLLTTVLGHAELLRSDLAALGDDAVPAGHLATLTQAADDGAALVRKIQQYIRNEKQEREEPVALHTLADEVLMLTRPYWHNEPRRRGIAIHVERDLSPGPPILGTPTELREVLVNLVLNAVQAMPAGGTLTLRTLAPDARTAVVEVEDTGTGMSERVRRRIFEPLYSTKGAAGTGMGLTVSQGIVHEHGGRIEVDSAPGRGTRFRLVFPLAAEHPAPEVASAAPTATAASAGARVLVVDDEPMVRTVTAKLLRLRGHSAVEADGGVAALALLAAPPDGAPFDIVVTDLSMPQMSGRELATAVRALYPALPVLLLTGDTDAEAEGGDVDAVVKKPYTLDVLDGAVRRLVRPVASGQ
jgi:signal transduction histidine kinase